MCILANQIGTVISTDEGPSVTGFSFVIDEANPVRRGQFVTVESHEGVLIARVSDIVKSNRYYQRAESVREYERSGKKMSDLFPVSRWEFLIGEAKPLAVFSSVLQRPAFPPSPGTPVHVADDKMLASFIGLDAKKGLHMGNLGNHDVDARLNLTKLFQKHLAILSISGGGKSYLTSVLIEELLERKPEDGQIAAVMIDTHGEYMGFAEDEKYRNKTTVVSGRDFKIGVPDLSVHLIEELIPEMTSVQKRELERVIDEMREEFKGKVFGLTEVANKIAADERIKSNTKDVLMANLYKLRNTGFFGVADNPSMDVLAKPGHLTVIDVSDTTSLQKRQMLVAYLGRKLFQARMDGRVPPFVLFVEEAHNFAPEGVSKEGALSRNVIEKIAREGRKFHASLCLISQRPIQLSTTALSQCNTHIILRVTNPYDLDHIGKSSEGLTRDVLDIISSLRVGEALIVGEAVNYPIFVRVRERRSKKSERGVPLEEAAVAYAKGSAQRKSDAAALMDDGEQ
ncbi:MAG: ATP-binding protein [Candidatus Aenigmatarchaeota archaeon]|nr:MAG: ATP-binding protein [Candidatus Aenigmarchaeota archaeon]